MLKLRSVIVLQIGMLLAAGIAVSGKATRRVTPSPTSSPSSASPAIANELALVDRYCISCHDDDEKAGDFSFERFDLAHPEANAAQAEKIILKLRTGLMPPAGRPRPDAATLHAFASALASRVDAASPRDPGRPLLHRLNRTDIATPSAICWTFRSTPKRYSHRTTSLRASTICPRPLP